jgi:hypothetical protein
MLATTAPSTAGAFTKAARSRLSKAHASRNANDRVLFVDDGTGDILPGADLLPALRHARSLYGAGLGLTSLDVFAEIISSTIERRWTEDGTTAEMLAIIDGDLCQAIQSTKEEIEAGRASDMMVVRSVVARLRSVIQQSAADVAAWSDDFPFERAAVSIDCWKV